MEDSYATEYVMGDMREDIEEVFTNPSLLSDAKEEWDFLVGQVIASARARSNARRC